MKIQVTREDIEKGRVDAKGARSSTCPIAQAIHRITGENRVNVFNSWASIAGVTYSLPGDAQDFIDRADRNKSVEPFEFDMERTDWR